MDEHDLTDETVSARVWHVTVPAIALVEATSAVDAEQVVVAALERAGLVAYDEDRRVFESEPVPAEHLFDPWAVEARARRTRSWMD